VKNVNYIAARYSGRQKYIQRKFSKNILGNLFVDALFCSGKIIQSYSFNLEYYFDDTSLYATASSQNVCNSTRKYVGAVNSHLFFLNILHTCTVTTGFKRFSKKTKPQITYSKK